MVSHEIWFRHYISCNSCIFTSCIINLVKILICPSYKIKNIPIILIRGGSISRRGGGKMLLYHKNSLHICNLLVSFIE